MRRTLLGVVAWGFGLLAVAAPANQAMACWCSRVYTSYYVDPCVSCTTPVGCYSCPTSCPTSSCPTSGCYTSRCYLEPQVSYRVFTRWEPQLSYVRRSYYDPYSCCSRSYYLPATEYVERSYQVPVTSYVQRCYSEPTLVQPAGNGDTSARDSQAPEPRPSERSTPGPLERPVHRESSPPPNPAPRPIPMPDSQSSRSRSVTLNGFPQPNSIGMRSQASRPPSTVSFSRRVAEWP